MTIWRYRTANDIEDRDEWGDDGWEAYAVTVAEDLMYVWHMRKPFTPAEIAEGADS